MRSAFLSNHDKLYLFIKDGGCVKGQFFFQFWIFFQSRGFKELILTEFSILLIF